MSRKEMSESGETLAVIREEQLSPTSSSVKLDANVQKYNVQSTPRCKCLTQKNKQISKDEVDELLKEQEESLREEYERRLDREIQSLKERFDFILENEQIRTSYMLCEAHRERKEKISALQTQLECKNLAGLMYVLCSERRKSKLEKMQMAQEYTKYIDVLQETLIDAQALILRLVNGYKTGSKLDESWRNKMNEVIKEYQSFVNNFVNDTPEMNQYFFDLAKLIETELPVFKPAAAESKISITEPKLSEIGQTEDRPWFDMLEGSNAPFVMYGDMADFKPNLRRNVLKTLKSTKEPPDEWEHYVINDTFVKSQCPNAGLIKDEYLKLLPKPGKWECSTIQTDRESSTSHRVTQASVDIRGNMGSILKIIASSAYGQPATRATILGARDSMEIASTTKLREKVRNSVQNKVVINIGNKRTTKFDDYPDISQDYSEEVETIPRQEVSQVEEDEIIEESFSALGSIHNDSMQVIPSHVPDQDAKINYEKVCPMEECQRMQVDSFIRSLPPYMQANPYMRFEKTYEEYEPCSPEQLDILRQRIENKKRKSKLDVTAGEESPLQEWDQRSNTVAAQTSAFTLPPCTCPVNSTVEENVHGIVYNIEDLLPVKRAINEINKKFFFDSTIEFNRFKVVGQNGDSTTHMMERKKDNRFYEIQNMLRQRPSLCDMLPNNAR
ncbi:PREDICTED: uncharacterized protein LOC106116314 [Papilio xuthus]|uniref:Uncharacterized protein LOC106116314 n=1 Tax=Papilio xuthus TaxID=66420 RepID=A0AAJ6Z560_PAPXU|nr:PREDICTED: uncharacterized protein LOC106116314 [Papilio xuthus]